LGSRTKNRAPGDTFSGDEGIIFHWNPMAFPYPRSSFMPVRLLTCCAVLALIVAAPRPAQAADTEKTKPPTLVVRLKSLDDLVQDAKFLAKYAGREEESNQGEGFLRAILGGDDMPTIDTKKPLGFYGSISDDVVNSGGVILIPVANEKNFLDLIQRFGVNAKKDKDGSYEVTTESFPVPLPVYMRFANGYAYVTMRDKTALEKGQMLDPAKVLGMAPLRTLSVTFRIDQIPDGLRQIGLSVMDTRLAEEQEKKLPGETQTQQSFRKQVIKDVGQQISTVLNDGGVLNAFVDVDRTKKQVVAEASLSGQANSKLATKIADLGKAQSLFAAWPTGKDALDLLVHVWLPENLRQALAPVIDEGLQKMVQSQTNEVQRGLAGKLIKALEPTFKAGELDLGVSVTGPGADQHYTAVAGIKLRDGQALDKFLHEVVPMIPERDRQKIKLDAETAGNIKIHRLDAQGDFNPAARRLMGENPIYFAIRSNALLVGSGPDGLKALKGALAAQPKVGPLVQLDLAVARLAPAMVAGAKSHGDSDAAQYVEKASKESFKGPGGDLIRLTVQGGNDLKIQYVIQADALGFFGKVAPRAAQRGSK
jgi:hypothetical protein